MRYTSRSENESFAHKSRKAWFSLSILPMTTQSEEQRSAQREPQPVPVQAPPPARASVPVDDDLEPYNLPFTD